MSDLIQAKELVVKTLEEDAKARNSDDYLFLKVCEAINAEFPELPFAYAMQHRKAYGIPAYETVRRARQKAQEERADLRAVKAVEDARAEKEHDFFEFAVGRAE